VAYNCLVPGPQYHNTEIHFCLEWTAALLCVVSRVVDRCTGERTHRKRVGTKRGGVDWGRRVCVFTVGSTVELNKQVLPTVNKSVQLQCTVHWYPVTTLARISTLYSTAGIC
jgi:hypothetical protein